MSMTTISPQRLLEVLRSGQEVDLIDVRTPAEFQEVHISYACNLPLDQLDPAQLALRRRGAEEPLYFVCRSGNRSKQACEKLLRAGHLNVVNVEGGTAAWDEAGLPVVRGRAVMSLERQVRIAAGLMVVAGTALGFFVHPYWLGLAAFVGAGLTFAGVTDTCGMGLILAKMPWNQVKSTKPDAAQSAPCATPMCC